MTSNKIQIDIANPQDRKRIYKIRHDVFALELGQHPENEDGYLSDHLDAKNIYFVAKIEKQIIGFICITPPSIGTYSIDKYLSRDQLPFEINDSLYEMRILTVIDAYRKSAAALLLMWAAYRWIDTHGGTNIMAIGKLEVLDLYLKLGFEATDLTVTSGDVNFQLIHGNIKNLNKHVSNHLVPLYKKLMSKCHWQLAIPFFKPTDCYHGGAFFNAIGATFNDLNKRHDIINADVLDAWFPPSPKITETLKEHLPWIARTSPPTDCGGMTEVIASLRGVKPENILPGAGSSDLIFLAFREWLTSTSKVLILDPMYGEYIHVLENMIECQVDRLPLSSATDYKVDLEKLASMAHNQ